MQLRTVVGEVNIQIYHGQDGKNGAWGCPIREQWALTPHQQMSHGLEEKLAFTATLAGSYEDASQLAEKWGSPVAASTIHQLVQRLGQQAEEKTVQRLTEVPQEKQPLRAAAALAVIMSDGWMARFRGAGWGCEKTKKDRVEWHEIKTGVFYLQEQLVKNESGRRTIADKALVRWQGEPVEFGRRLNWEAVHRGLGRAKEIVGVADGGKWIWNLMEDRWPDAWQLLDFYHASEHLNALALAYCGEESAGKEWSQARSHRLRHGKEKSVLAEIAGLKPPRGVRGELVRKAKNYFHGQAERMNYKTAAERGWPIGSGPVESACRQSQCRFKRSGQFWTQAGFRHLSAIDEARRNGHWTELWTTES